MTEDGTARPASIQTAPPTLDAFRTSAGAQLAIWCKHCRQLHYHSAVGPKTGEGNGHRAPHCLDAGSPYLRTGYFIREVSRVLWLGNQDAVPPPCCRNCGEIGFALPGQETRALYTCRFCDAIHGWVGQ